MFVVRGFGLSPYEIVKPSTLPIGFCILLWYNRMVRVERRVERVQEPLTPWFHSGLGCLKPQQM